MAPKITKSSRCQDAKRRKAARRAEAVKADVTKCLEDDELSSDSRAEGVLLLNRAKQVQNLGRKSCRRLKTASRRFVKAVNRAAALRSIEASQASQRYLFESGDAMSLALKALAATELQHVVDDEPYQEMVKKWQDEKGVTDSKKIRIASSWRALAGRFSSNVEADIDREWDLVTSWAQQGSNALAENAPSTPYLDRLALLCRNENLDRMNVLRWIYSYSDRNENAHHPIPLVEDYPNAGGWTGDKGTEVSHLCVDWKKLQEDTDARIEEIRNSEAVGIYTAEQANEFISAINYRLRKLLKIGEHGEVEPTEKTKSDTVKVHDSVLKRLKINEAPAPDFPSPYTEGKWDDFKDTAKPFSNI